jgi:hypothetical protein
VDIASIFDWFAQDSRRAAEHTDDPKEREILLKPALQWAAAAERSHDEAATQSTPPRNLAGERSLALPRTGHKHPKAPSSTTRWTPSERQDVGTDSRTLTWASLVVLEMGEGAPNGHQDAQGPLSEAR